jgi:hypothetical protein
MAKLSELVLYNWDKLLRKIIYDTPKMSVLRQCSMQIIFQVRRLEQGELLFDLER